MLRTFQLPAALPECSGQNSFCFILPTGCGRMALQHQLQSWNILCLQVPLGCVQESMCHLPDWQKQRNGRDHFFFKWVNFMNRIQVWQRVGKLSITIFHWRYIYKWMAWLSYFSSARERKIPWFFSLIKWKENFEGKRHNFAPWKTPYSVGLRTCALGSLPGTHQKSEVPDGPSAHCIQLYSKYSLVCGERSAY